MKQTSGGNGAARRSGGCQARCKIQKTGQELKQPGSRSGQEKVADFTVLFYSSAGGISYLEGTVG